MEGHDYLKKKKRKQSSPELEGQARNIHSMGLFCPMATCWCLPLIKSKWKPGGAFSLDHLPEVVSLVLILMV